MIDEQDRRLEQAKAQKATEEIKEQLSTARFMSKKFLKFMKRDTLNLLIDEGILRHLVTTDLDYKVRPKIISGAEKSI